MRRKILYILVIATLIIGSIGAAYAFVVGNVGVNVARSAATSVIGSKAVQVWLGRAAQGTGIAGIIANFLISDEVSQQKRAIGGVDVYQLVMNDGTVFDVNTNETSALVALFATYAYNQGLINKDLNATTGAGDYEPGEDFGQISAGKYVICSTTSGGVTTARYYEVLANPPYQYCFRPSQTFQTGCSFNCGSYGGIPSHFCAPGGICTGEDAKIGMLRYGLKSTGTAVGSGTAFEQAIIDSGVVNTGSPLYTTQEKIDALEEIAEELWENSESISFGDELILAPAISPDALEVVLDGLDMTTGQPLLGLYPNADAIAHGAPAGVVQTWPISKNLADQLIAQGVPQKNYTETPNPNPGIGTEVQRPDLPYNQFGTAVMVDVYDPGTPFVDPVGPPLPPLDDLEAPVDEPDFFTLPQFISLFPNLFDAIGSLGNIITSPTPMDSPSGVSQGSCSIGFTLNIESLGLSKPMEISLCDYSWIFQAMGNMLYTIAILLSYITLFKRVFIGGSE